MSIPVMKATANPSQLVGESLQQAISSIQTLISSLKDLKRNDSKMVVTAISEILSFCNGAQKCKQGDIRALGHNLLQKSGVEASLSFDFLVTLTAAEDELSLESNEKAAKPSSGASAARGVTLIQLNPFLTSADADGVHCCIMLLMMTCNRISHVNLALQQAESLLKILNSLQKCSTDKLRQQILTELSSSSDNLASTLAAKRNFTKNLGNNKFSIDPRFLLFEFCHGLILRPSQVTLVNKLVNEMEGGRSVCHQMIMGAGKTTVVGPLLAMLLADATTLMFEVVPPALLDFSAGVLRERFSSAVTKPVFTFVFDRYSKVTPQLYSKLLSARNLRAVVVASPSSVKSFMLKFVEVCHNLNRQKNLQSETQQVAAQKGVTRSILSRLGFGSSKGGISSMQLSREEVINERVQADLCEKIFNLLRASIEIMDEVDVILHPLKSELNWPLGAKDPLDFTRSKLATGLRWGIPSHLFDAVFSCCGMGLPVVTDIADSRGASELLTSLEGVIREGFDTLCLQKSPHLVLLSRNFYDIKMKPLLAKWLLLWLRARKLPSVTDDEAIEFLLRGNQANNVIMQKIKTDLSDDHVKLLNLGHDWLVSYLPFVLQKINRVNFGLLQPHDISLLESAGVKIPASRKLTAVPFIAKDVPSRSSEFAHPDILIGLTILAFRYEGLRRKDFYLLLRHLRDSLDEQGGAFHQRPSSQIFEQWILSCGKRIRGSKKREKNTKLRVIKSSSELSSLEQEKEKMNIFADIFNANDDMIWPLYLIDENDRYSLSLTYVLTHLTTYSLTHSESSSRSYSHC
jgi:hypothetical protein